MSSPALQHKIAKMKANAPHELPKARLCAKVILAELEGAEAMRLAVMQLKQGLGNNWSRITALQFMSGRGAEFAADCAAPEEQVQLRSAHQMAKLMCSPEGFRASPSASGFDMKNNVDRPLPRK